MSKKLTIALCMLFMMPINMLAQEDRFWYFGVNGVGIDFGSCEPLLVEGAIDGFEGALTVSDEEGNLLFYSNSDYIWNANHQIMQGGEVNGFAYDPFFNPGFLSTNTQLALAQNPTNPDLYYLFTVDAQNVGFSPCMYATVDMSLDGGLGAVTEQVELPVDNVEERICTVPKEDGSGMWVITHEYLNDRFLAFEVTGAGVNTVPVVSEVGDVHEVYPNNLNARGEMRANLEGNRLALVQDQMGGLIELFDFDQNTGSVSNPIEVGLIDHGFGISFSPNSQVLYVSTWVNFDTVDNRLVQFDISSNDPVIIQNSEVELATSSIFESFGSIRNAPDEKMYVARPNDFYSIIENPNTVGLGCSFIDNGIFVGTNEGSWGLNNLWEIEAQPLQTVELDLGEDITSCTPIEIGATVDDGENYSWNTSEETPFITVEESGVYSLTVDIGPCTYTDEIEVEIGLLSLDLGEDISACEGDEVVLEVPGENTDVEWGSGETENTLSVTSSGTYSVFITQGDCEAEDSIEVTFVESPSAVLGNDTTSCESVTLTLDLNEGETILWNTNESTASIEVSETGVYNATVSIGTCSATDEISIEILDTPTTPSTFIAEFCDDTTILLEKPTGWNHWLLLNDSLPESVDFSPGFYEVMLEDECTTAVWELQLNAIDCDCPVYFPNAFTPNLDGRNEVFSAVKACDGMEIVISIFNRWGEEIYTSESALTSGWTGNVSGGTYYAPAGIYTYRAVINNPYVDGDEVVYGHVTLIR